MSYYDMDGKEISFQEWGKLFESPNRQLRTDFDVGFVSTVWIGMIHHGPGKLNIFETMVFHVDGWDEYQERYDTKEEAIKRHNELVKEIEKEVKSREEAVKEFLNELKKVE